MVPGYQIIAKSLGAKYIPKLMTAPMINTNTCLYRKDEIHLCFIDLIALSPDGSYDGRIVKIQLQFFTKL